MACRLSMHAHISQRIANQRTPYTETVCDDKHNNCSKVSKGIQIKITF